MNKIKKIFIAIMMFMTAFSLSSFSQAIGDYITICNGPGPIWNWTGAIDTAHATWGIVYQTSPLASNPTTLNPTNLINTYVRTGHTVILNATPLGCANLTVEAGGKVWASAGSDRFLEIYGPSLVCDGQIGNGSTYDGIGLTFEGAICTVTGTGSIDVGRIKKNRNAAPAPAQATTTVTFARGLNTNVRYTNPNAADFGAGLYNASATSLPSSFNVVISSGDTLTVFGNASIDSAFTNGVTAGGWQHGGSVTVNGRMEVGGRLYLTTNNAAKNCKWQVNSGGYLKVDRIIASPVSGAGKDSLLVNSGGTLEIAGDSAFINIASSANSVYSFVSGSTAIYSSAAPTGNQLVRGSSGATDLGNTNSYGNLILSGAGIKSGATNIKAKNDITITSPVKFAPLTTSTNQIGGNWINYNDTGFTEGGSNWQFNGAAAQSLTTPGGENFATLTYSNTTASTLTFNSPISVDSSVTFSTNGKIDLNSNTLTIKNPKTTGINNSGNAARYFISEKTDNSSKITWKIGTTTSANQTYVFPFGTSSAAYIPDTLKVVASGTNMGNVTISTYGTPAGNTPLPTSPDLVANLDTKFQPSGLNDSDAVVDRFWQINSTVGDTSALSIADLSLTYAPSELPVAPYNVTAEIVAQWYEPDSNSWQWPVYGIAYGNTVHISSNTHYGPWALVNNNSPLPITLLEFTARLRDDAVNVNWSTSSEINNAGFTVERSRDGESFEKLGTVNGAGNSTQAHYYGLIDEHPFSGISYYRLRQTDYDGRHSLSEMVPVLNNKNKNSSWYVFPNPASDVIHVANTSSEDYADAVLQLFNPEGALIKTVALPSKGAAILSIDVKEFSNGIYIGKISDAYHQEIFKVVKN